MFLEICYHSRKRLKVTSNLIQIISKYFTTAWCVFRVSYFLPIKKAFKNFFVRYIRFPWVHLNTKKNLMADCCLHSIIVMYLYKLRTYDLGFLVYTCTREADPVTSNILRWNTCNFFSPSCVIIAVKCHKIFIFGL